MIRIYTKTRHIKKLADFFNSKNIEHEIFTIHDNPPLADFELGISYCYPRKIVEPLLSTPTRGFINYHPGPLPAYKGPNQYQNAIDAGEINWGVTLHYMDENYDTGPIITKKSIKLHEPPTTINELGAITHYFLFEFFKETILEICEK